MNINIKFHPVGFGLFTSGNIGKFKFVYDCGSTLTSRANKCVDEEFEVGEHLGFIAISHFHKDHISGLKRLLERVGHVDTIILPYLTPRERLNYLLTLELDYQDFDWVESFITDPAEYLLNSEFGYKISKIVFISNGPEKYFDENINEEEIKSIEGIEDSRILIKKHGCVPLTSGRIKIWQFIFYYCAQSDNVDRYLKEIADCSNYTSDNITKDDLISIINDAKFSKIAKGHGVSNSDINNTSLLLYHSPIQFKFKLHYDAFCEIYEENRIGHFNFWSRSCGHFYTGDVNLNQKHAEIIRFYGSLIENTAVLQVPHHGSIDNWHEFLSLKNQGMLHIISSKLNNSRGLHPNPEVLYQIIKHQGIVIWCNENREFILCGDIWYR